MYPNRTGERSIIKPLQVPRKPHLSPRHSSPPCSELPLAGHVSPSLNPTRDYSTTYSLPFPSSYPPHQPLLSPPFTPWLTHHPLASLHPRIAQPSPRVRDCKFLQTPTAVKGYTSKYMITPIETPSCYSESFLLPHAPQKEPQACNRHELSSARHLHFPFPCHATCHFPLLSLSTGTGISPTSFPTRCMVCA
jgi:hypothetical protein